MYPEYTIIHVMHGLFCDISKHFTINLFKCFAKTGHRFTLSNVSSNLLQLSDHGKLPVMKWLQFYKIYSH